jgi:predicted nucleic acid-binding protein
MNLFCDTSVLIAASLKFHSKHPPAKALLDEIARGEHLAYCSGHTLAETFSVLARMPTRPKLTSADILTILEHNVLPHFKVTTLDPTDYIEAVRAFAGTGFAGGRIYDLLHLHVARKLVLDRIYTLNAQEWTELAPELASIISEPPLRGA